MTTNQKNPADKQNFTQTLDFLKNISIPRYTKSKNSKIVEQKIESKFHEIATGIDSEKYKSRASTQEFKASTAFMSWLLNIIHPLVGILMIIIFSLALSGNYSAAFGVNIILFFFALFNRQIIYFLQFRVIKYGKQFPSSNIILDIKPQKSSEGNQNSPSKDKTNNSNGKNYEKTIVFMAHRDSIHHRIPPILESVGYFLGFIGGIAYSIHLFFVLLPCLNGACSAPPLKEIIWGLIVGIFTFMELFNQKTNKSQGVIDNGSGVASMYYLAKKIERGGIELKNTRVIFVATGAEELGDIGAYEFIKDYQSQLPLNSTKFVILDSIGTKTANTITYGIGIPIKHFSPYLEVIARSTNKKMGEKLDYQAIPPLLQVATDHVPIYHKGYPFLLFSSNSFTIFHTKKDNWNALDKRSFQSFLVFSSEFLKKIDRSPLT